MKRIAVFIAACYCIAAVNAQKLTEKHFPFAEGESVKLDIQIADTIIIKTWKQNEVYVKAAVNINENRDNDSYEIGFTESGKELEVEAGFRSEYFKGKDYCCDKSDIRWIVYLPAGAAISVSTINGNLTIEGKTGPATIKSVSGFVDIAVPSDERADLEFSTITGTVYTDHRLVIESGRTFIGTQIRRKINGGGRLIKLETISGDIFFRKSG